jgi:hypothetical protein
MTTRIVMQKLVSLAFLDFLVLQTYGGMSTYGATRSCFVAVGNITSRISQPRILLSNTHEDAHLCIKIEKSYRFTPTCFGCLLRWLDRVNYTFANNPKGQESRECGIC